jgi:predicted ABC-type ATPase
MSKSARLSPRCIIIAGPNGAGKTTFAREFLSKEVGVVHFVNPDLIASGLSPLRPELAALAAGRLFLLQLDRLARSKDDFAFESTLSGLTYLNRLKRWKAAGWRIELSTCGFHRRVSRYDEFPLGLSKAATMCLGVM